MKTLSKALVVLACLALAGPPLAAQGPLICPPGVDSFVTLEDTQVPCPGCEPLVFEQGFFGTKEVDGVVVPSDQKVIDDNDPIQMRGVPTGCPGPPCFTLEGPGCHQGMVGLHCTAKPVEPTPGDTCVRRTQKLELNAVGETRTTPIEILTLALESVEPVTVTYGGGAAEMDFAVTLDLDPGATQQQGLGRFTRTGESAIELEVLEEGALPVLWRLGFGGQFFLTPEEPDELTTEEPWRLEFSAIKAPSLTPWGLSILGLLLVASLAWLVFHRAS